MDLEASSPSIFGDFLSPATRPRSVSSFDSPYIPDRSLRSPSPACPTNRERSSSFTEYTTPSHCAGGLLYRDEQDATAPPTTYDDLDDLLNQAVEMADSSELQAQPAPGFNVDGTAPTRGPRRFARGRAAAPGIYTTPPRKTDIAPSDVTIDERIEHLMSSQRVRDERINEIRQTLQEIEEKECTWCPRISKNSQLLARERERRPLEETAVSEYRELMESRRIQYQRQQEEDMGVFTYTPNISAAARDLPARSPTALMQGMREREVAVEALRRTLEQEADSKLTFRPTLCARSLELANSSGSVYDRLSAITPQSKQQQEEPEPVPEPRKPKAHRNKDVIQRLTSVALTASAATRAGSRQFSAEHWTACLAPTVLDRNDPTDVAVLLSFFGRKGPSPIPSPPPAEPVQAEAPVDEEQREAASAHEDRLSSIGESCPSTPKSRRSSVASTPRTARSRRATPPQSSHRGRSSGETTARTPSTRTKRGSQLGATMRQTMRSTPRPIRPAPRPRAPSVHTPRRESLGRTQSIQKSQPKTPREIPQPKPSAPLSAPALLDDTLGTSMLEDLSLSQIAALEDQLQAEIAPQQDGLTAEELAELAALEAEFQGQL